MSGKLMRNTSKMNTMHFLDIAEIVALFPAYEQQICDIIEHHENLLNECLTKNTFYTAQSKTIQKSFNDPVYESIGRLVFGDSEIKDEDLEDANARLGVNVESETQAGLIKVVSALNICNKCRDSGASDVESRNVTSRMRFIRGWDEPGVEILTCQRCGHTWRR